MYKGYYHETLLHCFKVSENKKEMLFVATDEDGDVGIYRLDKQTDVVSFVGDEDITIYHDWDVEDKPEFKPFYVVSTTTSLPDVWDNYHEARKYVTRYLKAGGNPYEIDFRKVQIGKPDTEYCIMQNNTVLRGV